MTQEARYYGDRYTFSFVNEKEYNDYVSGLPISQLDITTQLEYWKVRALIAEAHLHDIKDFIRTIA